MYAKHIRYKDQDVSIRAGEVMKSLFIIASQNWHKGWLATVQA